MLCRQPINVQPTTQQRYKTTFILYLRCIPPIRYTMGVYSLAARCLTEFLGTTTAIFLGETIIANEVLPRTKGHDLGFGFVAVGFAFAFFVAILCFGFVSAHVNPASLISLAILNEITWVDFVALSVCEVAGAFFGAVLVYVHY